MPLDPEQPPEIHRYVMQKLTKVFGDRRAAALLAQVLEDQRLEQVATVDDLRAVAAWLQARGGFEATTGAMLGVHAQMLRMRER